MGVKGGRRVESKQQQDDMHINQEEYKVIYEYTGHGATCQGEFSRIAAKYNTLLTTLLYFASFCIVSL